MGTALACQRPAAPAKGKNMSVSYEAKVRESRWIAGARVVLDLRIENNGATPVETPDPMYRTSSQPHFEVTGPGGSKQEFRPDSRATEWDRGQPATIIRLAPGQQWEGDMVLSQFASLESPGEYTLRSWIEHQGARIESPPSKFEIIKAATRDLAAETSFGEENSQVVECVELLEGGLVASSILNEKDPRNAELLPFERLERGSTEPGARTILAPHSNFSVGLSALRWMVAERDGKLTVGHNLNPARRTAFGGGELSRFLPPVATKSGLYLAGVRGSELLLTRVTGSESGVETGPVWTVATLQSPPAAAAMSVSPTGERETLLFVLAWNWNGDGIRVQFLTVNPQGKVTESDEHTFPDFRPLGPAAAGWSTAGKIRASVLVRSMDKESEIRTMEFRLLPDLSLEGVSRSIDPAEFGSAMQDARVAYFESIPGQLSRMAVVRTSGGKAWVIPGEGAPRAPQTDIPATGPLAILPGQMHWYAVWPENGKLRIGPL